MKFFIISDIHGSLTAFLKAVAIFEKEQADCMIISGDFLNHGPRNDIPEGYNTKQLALRLNMLKNQIIGVRGNCDSEVDQMILDFPMMDSYSQIFLPRPLDKTAAASLEEAHPLKTLCDRMFIHHGHLYTQEQASSLTPAGSIIISGHTHVPELRLSNNHVFLNPGSLSIPKGGSEPSYALIETLPQGESFQFIHIALYTLEGVRIKSL